MQFLDQKHKFLVTLLVDFLLFCLCLCMCGLCAFVYGP